MSDLPRNIVVLTLHTVEEGLTPASEFCLDVALHRDGFIDEIWILTQGQAIFDLPNVRFARWDEKSKIKYINLDTTIWPMDAGNNLYLNLPLSVYEALKANDIPEKIYTPLKGAGAFFALQARKGGLIPETTKFITSCYLPRRLELSGSLTLPEHIKNVVDCELEEHCAGLTDEFWISQTTLVGEISKIFNLANHDKIFTLPLPAENQPLKPIGRHIIFAGLPVPLYGFDAFCDLAERLEDDLDEVTVFIQSTRNKTTQRWANSAYKRLSELNVTLNWQYKDNPGDGLEGLKTGVFIALMRAHCFPAEARAARAAGLTTVWGTGFDLKLPDTQLPGLYAEVADARRAASALQKVWGAPKSTKQAPLLLDPPTAVAAKPPVPKSAAPVKLLSVIITHHNRPEFLEQCLMSLARQTVSDFEVIIVDDGSVPEVVTRVEAMTANSALKSIKLTKIENSYPAAARNHGAQVARGEVLFFVDDDNILDPQTIASLSKAITHHDLALSFFQTFRGLPPAFGDSADIQGRAELKGPAYGFAGLLPGCGLFHNLTGNASLMIRREAFEGLGGFSAKFGIGLEDYALMLKGAFRGDLTWVVLPEAYLNFRLHDDKIRHSHVDWSSPVRLQAGHWRVIEGLNPESSPLSTATLAYARQLHELTQYTYIAQARPKYFRLRSIVLHQYLRPFLSRHVKLRRWVVKFTSSESRLAKRLEKWLF